MNDLFILPPAAKYIKKIKNNSLKKEFQNAIDNIISNPYVGTQKTGGLKGVYCYDISFKKVNYEVACIIVEKNNKSIIVIMAGARKLL